MPGASEGVPSVAGLHAHRRCVHACITGLHRRCKSLSDTRNHILRVSVHARHAYCHVS